MARIKLEKNKIYHIFNRGVEKRDVFLSDGDRWRFLQGMYLFNNENSTTNLLYRIEQEKGKMHFAVNMYNEVGMFADYFPYVDYLSANAITHSFFGERISY